MCSFIINLLLRKCIEMATQCSDCTTPTYLMKLFMSCHTVFPSSPLSLLLETSWHPNKINCSLPQPLALQQCNLPHRLLALPSFQSEPHCMPSRTAFPAQPVHSVSCSSLLARSGPNSDVEASLWNVCLLQEQVLLCLGQASILCLRHGQECVMAMATGD